MNKINKNKLIRTLAVLAAICIIAGGITQLAGVNSMTLTEYVQKNRQNLPEEESRKESDTQPETMIPEEEVSAGPDDTAPEAPKTEPEEAGAPALTGASLNGDSQISERVSCQEGFYYEPLSDHLKRYITGISFPALPEEAGESPAITYDSLCYLHILHYDFNGNPTEGELICNKAIAPDLAEIFYELYVSEYQLERVRLIDEYDGDDLASMEDNNTSCFNYRVVEGSTSLSRHALGLAVDINPLYNPYITYEKDGRENVSPAAASEYADRDAAFPYKIDENDLCYKLFKEHGFTWGGDWNSCKDYQHFQKVPQ